MSETVAVALISALPATAVALAALVGNFLLDQRRRNHEEKQLAGQFAHEREMRLLEWRRADRLERLAPIREFLDAFSREVTNFALAMQHVEKAKASSSGEDEIKPLLGHVLECLSRLQVIFEQQHQAVYRAAFDDQLLRLLHDFTGELRALMAVTGESLLQESPPKSWLDLTKTTAHMWNRLEELQSAL